MSMLSEPRRRQKWTLNPRGNLWSKDENKIGQKMIEKMGWSQGKGLGASEQGLTKHISVVHKDDNKGIGFEGHDNAWIAHQDDFAAVLADLNQVHGGGAEENEQDKSDAEVETTKQSLERQSKSLKKRVHYHKFTRGKDLSRYSSNDLSCILGSKAVEKKRKEKKEEAEMAEMDDHHQEASEPMVGFKTGCNDQESKDSDAVDDGRTEKMHGFVTIKGGSLNDYFAKKMAALKSRSNNGGEASSEKPVESDAKELPEIKSAEEKTSKKRKKSKKSELKEESCPKRESSPEAELAKAKKGKKARSEVKGTNCSKTDSSTKRKTLNAEESISEKNTGVLKEEPSSRKSVPKTKKRAEADSEETPTDEIEPPKKRKKSKGEEDETKASLSKKSKKLKSNGELNEDNSHKIKTVDMQEPQLPKKKKKSKKSEEKDKPVFESRVIHGSAEANEERECAHVQELPKSKKKKSKKKEQENVIVTEKSMAVSNAVVKPAKGRKKEFPGFKGANVFDIKGYGS